MFELNGQLLDKLPVEVWVAVFRKLVEDKPVPQLSLREDICQALLDVLVILVPDLKTDYVDTLYCLAGTYYFVYQAKPDTLKKQSEGSMEQAEDRVGHKEGVPELKHKVYFIIDYILGKQKQFMAVNP